MPRYAVKLELDGAGFSGSQAQSEGRTVQGELDRALAALGSDSHERAFSGRLDAGVSALGLVAHVTMPRTWDPGRLGAALNGHLPHDVAVVAVASVSDTWHARFATTGKTYAYRLMIRPSRPVLDRRVWWVKRLDHPERLAELASALIGRHDLSAFANLRGDGTDQGDPIRRVRAAVWERESEGWIFRITADGFLYRQVRGLVGAMVAVAQGRHAPAEFMASIDRGRRGARLGATAPAQGLLLERVFYEPEPEWQPSCGSVRSMPTIP